ncbi:cytochrome P450 [Streptomyces sp. NPDC006463]|uniref:cytochrome P450 n=1 Tax=Streptomyces sp. NPDC006463 TaxID=3364746 RepID=UPI0036A2ABEB
MRMTTAGESVDLSAIDFFEPSLYATGHPHAAWRTLRADHPVYWQRRPDGTGFWVLTRYRDVCRVLRNFRDFSSESGNLLTTLGKKDLGSGKMLAVTDPPHHTAIKRQINTCFARSAVEALEPQIRVLARRVFAPGCDGDVFDLAAQTAFYPIAITALLMGIDPSDWGRLKRFAYVAIADQDPEVASGGQDRALEWSHSEIFAYFGGQFTKDLTQRRDLMGAIANARIGDRPLSREEKLFNAYSVLLGATVTSSHAANASFLALADNRKAETLWRRERCTDTFVEEVFRWSSPANHFMRHATKDIKIHDTLIRAGDPVTVWLGSANRDEAVFEDPYAFDVRRDPRLHIAFGVGAHRCIGAPLARLAMRIFAEETLRIVESFEIAGPVDHLASHFISGIKHLPVKIVPTRDARRELASLDPLDNV